MRRRLLAGLVAVLTVAGSTFAPGAATPALAAKPDPEPCQQGFLGPEAPVVEAECETAIEGAPELASQLPSGFRETVVWSGLNNPTTIRFAADGRVFVAEKSGVIKVFESLSDSSPTVFNALVTNVQNFWDRGLLGLALDPSMTGGSGTGSFIYALYAYDHILGTGGGAPRWGDGCPSPPGPTTDGCVVSGRLSRFAVSGTTISGSEQVLLEDWCQQYPSHSVGTVTFGPGEALYVSGGDGSSFNVVDYGQLGGSTNPVVTPRNPCGDPPGGSMNPPSAEGGSLRSQDVRTTGDPTSLGGSILRINPSTGAGMAGNPFAGSSDANARRIIAYGLRNPFRITTRPGTNELWVGDVGWSIWEEINRIPNATDGVAENFGWPCYEGNGRQGGYDAPNLTLCETLYSAGSATSPVFTYHHGNAVVSGEDCSRSAGSAITGMAFYPRSGGPFPAAYRGALFFADHNRNCIWYLPEGGNGQPNAGSPQMFIETAAHPVDIVIGPSGDLFYPDLEGGTIRRVSWTSGNQAPVAEIDASPVNGTAPLAVQFSGADSSDPEGFALSYAWDLDGDGQYDDATGVSTSRTYTNPGNVTVGLRVTDVDGGTDTDTQVIGVGNSPPVPSINSPSASLNWRVGDQISFSGSATDPQEGTLPASRLTWALVQQHCPSACHSHTVQTWDGVASGSFAAPDHEFPSYIELRLTATDSSGVSATTTRRLDPDTVVLTYQTSPAGLQLSVNGTSSTAPFSRTVIVGSANSVVAPSPQSLAGATHTFQSWSNGGDQAQVIFAPVDNTSYTASYQGVGGVISIVAQSDTHVRSRHPGKNYGTGMALRVRSGSYRTYLKFTVTGLSGAAEDAKLRVWVTNGGPDGGDVRRVSNSWTETGLKWRNQPRFIGARLDTGNLAKAGHWEVYDLRSVIKGNGTYSFVITGGSANRVYYASRESTHDPTLVITP